MWFVLMQRQHRLTLGQLLIQVAEGIQEILAGLFRKVLPADTPLTLCPVKLEIKLELRT